MPKAKDETEVVDEAVPAVVEDSAAAEAEAAPEPEVAEAVAALDAPAEEPPAPESDLDILEKDIQKAYNFSQDKTVIKILGRALETLQRLK